MKKTDASRELSPGPAGKVRAVGIAATAGAMVLAVALSVRPIASYDVGYHLAYGDHFLKTGEIVQTNRFVYTRLDPKILSDPSELGPGCRYDNATDTYHFVNANWLSQVIMALAHKAGGMSGLGILQTALIAAIFLVVVAAMRSGSAAWHWIAPAVVLTALGSYERFNIRPEVFGYLILVLQWWLVVGYEGWHCLLASSVATSARISKNTGCEQPVPPAKRMWWRAAGVIGLQVLAVNLHSYFILGVAIVGAMFIASAGRWLWVRFVNRVAEAAPAGRLKWLGITLAGVVAACLVNPWFVRGAIMPIQTLLFMNRHNIAGGAYASSGGHPWAEIGEFFTPFAEGVRRTRVITAYYVVLCLAGIGGVVGVLRRRWGWVLILAGMTIVSTRMRRNIAPAAMIIVPMSVIILTDGWNALRERLRRGKRGGSGDPPRLKIAFAAAIITLAAAGLWTVSIMTNRFYFSERRLWRFGWGVSDITIPLESARWINTNRPAGRVFCDYGSSSNLMYYIQPEYEVPVLTNTWAYPPYVMRWVSDCTKCKKSCDFAKVVGEYGIETVVLRLAGDTSPLIGNLSKSPVWTVVHVGVSHVVFLRRNGANAELAKSLEITESDFDIYGFTKRIFVTDPLPAHSLHIAASLLDRMGWSSQAITVWRKCLRQGDNYYEAMNGLGRRLALRGTDKMLLMQKYYSQGKPVQGDQAKREGLNDWAEAEKLFKDALKIKPDYEDAVKNQRQLTRQKDAFVRGVILGT
ncbi:MAG: hypothetical protein SVV80_11125 [Planctomycetota bacterium]|nr:hypothetical protein [Planctomycetota bacterium]